MPTEDKIESVSNHVAERKILLKNTFFSYLNNFSVYILSIVTSFFISRLISMDLWGFIIIAISYISIINIIVSFLPPGLNIALIYYVSRYKAANEKGQLKSVIKYSIGLKIIILIPVFIITIIFFNALSELFEINLENHINLLFIFSPLIIINQFNPIFASILQGFNKFNLVFYMNLIRYSVEIAGLFIIFSLQIFFPSVTVEQIAFITLLSFCAPFIIKFCIIARQFFSIKNVDKGSLTFKQFFKQMFSYGTYVELGVMINNLWDSSVVQSISIFENQGLVTIYTIALNYASVPRMALLSKNQTLRVSFSRLSVTSDHDQIKKIFNLLFNYGLFLYLLLNGIFFFFSDFFLFVVYVEEYQIYAYVLKLLALVMIFNVLGAQLEALIHSTNKVNQIPKIKMYHVAISTPIFFIGIIFFGFDGMLISMFIYFFLQFLLATYLCYYMFKIKLHYRKISFLYISFSTALGVSSLLEFLFLKNLRIALFDFLHLPFLENLPIFSVLIFVLIFLIMILIFKPFSYEELQFLENIFTKDRAVYKLIKKSLKILKRLLNIKLIHRK